VAVAVTSVPTWRAGEWHIPLVTASSPDALALDDGGAVAAAELRALRRAAGWSDPEADDALVDAALASTWNVTARDGDGRLVGLCRVLDDGLFYATLWDMLVLPEFRRRGLGSRMVELILERCRDRQIIALVATPAGRPLYEAAGFRTESRGSVGMLRRSRGA
jgi:GNAT superfamily N-acetyltransferase